MKVIATTRTLNEENNIERFCRVYGAFCDEIIVVDGGSEDATVEIAKSMPKTQVFIFNERVYGENDLWRNPHGEHINWCVSLAGEMNADWVIFDDCDDVPNHLLWKRARDIFSQTDLPSVLAYRLYVYGEDKYFPKMNEPGQSLWAWKIKELDLWADETDPWKHHIPYPPEDKQLKLELPLCLLHYFAPDEETIQKKLDFYVNSGQHPTLEHPLKSNGPLEELPEYARWDDE